MNVKNKQEQKELKIKIREFAKKYFVYYQTDPNISDETKQELTKLGAKKPYYSDSKDQRSIKLGKLLLSEKEGVKNIALKEIQLYFSINNPAELNSLFIEIKTYQTNLNEKIKKLIEIKKNKEHE